MEIYKLVPLATCPHLANDVVLLLNSEWPRSDTVRQRSISKVNLHYNCVLYL